MDMRARVEIVGVLQERRGLKDKSNQVFKHVAKVMTMGFTAEVTVTPEMVDQLPADGTNVRVQGRLQNGWNNSMEAVAESITPLQGAKAA